MARVALAAGKWFKIARRRGNKALAQLSSNPAANRFLVAIYKPVDAANVPLDRLGHHQAHRAPPVTPAGFALPAASVWAPRATVAP